VGRRNPEELHKYWEGFVEWVKQPTNMVLLIVIVLIIVLIIVLAVRIRR